MRKAILATLSLILGALLLASPANAGTQPAADDFYEVTPSSGRVYLKFGHSGKCLDNPNYSTANDVWLDQWNCVAQSNEQWRFTGYKFGPGGWKYWQIENVYSEKCVNVDHGLQTHGAHVIQYNCGNYNNEHFALLRRPSMPAGYVYVVAMHSGQVLTVAGNSLASGAKIIQYPRCACGNQYVKLAAGPLE